MRRRGASSAGKNDPVRVFGIRTVTSPEAVVTVLSRWPLRWVVRALMQGHRVIPSLESLGRFSQSLIR